MLRVLDLFSGIGGFSLGLESTGGFRTVAFCEIEPFCREVLYEHWPEVVCFNDIKKISAGTFKGEVEVITGGFPCQDISVAGKGAGIEGKRSGLWKEMYRIIEGVRPRWVVVENVRALRTRGSDRVLSDLEEAGYSCWPLVVGAWAVGAPHRRERVWIVAHAGRGRGDGRGERLVGLPRQSRLAGGRGRSRSASEKESLPPGSCGHRWPARPGEPQHEWEEPRLAYTGKPNAAGRREAGGRRGWPEDAPGDRTRAREAQGPPELSLGGAVDGLPERLARRWNRESLKALGNSVVPQVVQVIGKAILDLESG